MIKLPNTLHFKIFKKLHVYNFLLWFKILATYLLTLFKKNNLESNDRNNYRIPIIVRNVLIKIFFFW